MANAHAFHAYSFVESLPLRDLARQYPGSRLTPHELCAPLDADGTLRLYPFGSIVFEDVEPHRRAAELEALRTRLRLTLDPEQETLTVVEQPGEGVSISPNGLRIEKLTGPRADVISLVMAQSTAMVYYERIVDRLFGKTASLVQRLETRGSVPLRTRGLHRFIGEAIGIRNEVLSVLHLLDKPDETWDDPGALRINDELRSEFDLADRYQALESKLRGVQEALELILDVARDRRLLLLEVTVVLLILLELVLSLRHIV
jgi:uncharacterized Rmd1/YagE family protein